MGGLDPSVIIRSPGFPSDVRVDSLAIDHRAVKQGSLFFAIEGSNFDGHLFLDEAQSLGAVAAIVSRFSRSSLPQAKVTDGTPRATLALLADRLYQHPSSELTMIGVTGTNGKTTVTHLISKLLNILGTKSEALGTLWGRLTTPESPDLQRRLRDFVSIGVQAVAMEVSSHSLVMHRVDMIDYDAAIFTNLTQDHLDFHGDMENYFRAKTLLFRPEMSKLAVVNSDDPFGARLIESRPDAINFGLDDVTSLELGQHGVGFEWRRRRIISELFGLHNVYNILAAVTTLSALGYDEGELAESVSMIGTPNGRLEPVGVGLPFSVIIDYAHTPAALEAALVACRTVASGQLILVFGCGGDRDRAKRPEMGAVAARLSDLAIVTTDNPRSEDPTQIIDEIVRGFQGRGRFQVIEDRRGAIAEAIELAQPGDLVLIAGKGHETTQRKGDSDSHFDDHEVARLALASRFASGEQ